MSRLPPDKLLNVQDVSRLLSEALMLPSSPSTVKPASASAGKAPIVAIRPSAIGRS